MTTAKILLVDDVRVFIEFERPFFERAGCSILTASSGPEALRIVREEKPHIVLLDYQMPGMNGDEVCRRMKQDPATRHIPVLIVTTHATPEITERCLRAGCTDFVGKPITGTQLLRKVVDILQIPFRVHLRTRVSMEVTMGLAGEPTSVLGYSDNISEGGMLVEVPEPIEAGTDARVTFRLPGLEEKFTASMEVVRVTHIRSQGLYAAALRFSETDRGLRAAVKAYVEREVGA